MATATRLQQLRGLMCSGKYCSDTLSAYVIPTDDQHQVRAKVHILLVRGNEYNFSVLMYYN